LERAVTVTPGMAAPAASLIVPCTPPDTLLCAETVLRRAEALGVDMPITATVRDVLDGHLTAAAAVERLMKRDPKHE